MKNPIAIRSLQCPDHAINIPPTVLDVLVFLTKRCNYNCSYCSPHIHDSVSPFADLPRYQKFIESITQQSKNDGKKIKWSFTGGEPFLDPGFLPILEQIHRSPRVLEQINVTTNGSFPYQHYEKFLPFLNGITFSLHLERSDEEIEKKINLINKINQDGRIFVSVNLMFLPGRMPQVKTIIETFAARGIKFVLRKISPPDHDQDDYQPGIKIDGSRKSLVLHDKEQQKNNKRIWSIINDRGIERRLSDYYDIGEQSLLAAHSEQDNWQNIGVWYDDGSYQEKNTDALVAINQNRFENWICWAGVDRIFVDFDGTVYRGMCQVGDAIGSLDDQDLFQADPVICDRKWCNCVADVAVRKSLKENMVLVLGQSKERQA